MCEWNQIAVLSLRLLSGLLGIWNLIWCLNLIFVKRRKWYYGAILSGGCISCCAAVIEGSCLPAFVNPFIHMGVILLIAFLAFHGKLFQILLFCISYAVLDMVLGVLLRLLLTEAGLGYEPWQSAGMVLAKLLLALICALLFWLYRKLMDRLVFRSRCAVYGELLESFQADAQAQKKQEEELRRFRHDIKNRLLTLKALMEQEAYSEVNQELDSMLGISGIAGTKRLLDTGNYLMDLLVNAKLGQAKENGISLDLNISVPLDLPFPDTDLSILLGNLLDNASEAALRCPEGSRMIRLSVIYDRRNLLIGVENSFDGIVRKNTKGVFQTRKEDFANHGIGLGTVSELVKRCHGCLSVEYTEDRFLVNIILYGKEK